MLSITTKIILACTIVFGVMLTLFAYVIYRSTEDAEMTKLDARLESHADKIMTELEEDSNEPVSPDRTALAALRTEGLTDVRFQLIDKKGAPIFADSILAGLDGSGWQQAFRGISTKEDLVVAGGRLRLRCLWIRAEVNGQFPCVVEVAAAMSEAEASLRRLRVLFFIIIPAALSISALAAYGITRAAFRPIRGMVETARQITAENLHHRLTLPETRDEVRLLGETLNRMIDRIDTSFNSQRQFIADASHEIRSPLTVVCTELEYVAQRLTQPELRESVQASLSEIDRLAKLADGLLLLAKLDASQLRLDLRPVRLDELLLECIQRVRALAEKKHIEMRVDVQDPIEVQADREKLKSIFLNLLDNAVKYSPDGGVVTASLSFEKGEKADRLHAIVSVADSGPGIAASEAKNIFKRFYRVDPSRGDTQGSGLGLAIVERLVELHGGSISVESSEGKGSAFIVKLASNRQSGSAGG